MDANDRARIADQIRAAFTAHMDSDPQRRAAAEAAFRAILESHGCRTDVPGWGSLAYLKRIWRKTERPISELFEKTPRALVAYIKKHFRKPEVSAPPRARSLNPRPDVLLYSPEGYRKCVLDGIEAISRRTRLLVMPCGRGHKTLLREMRANCKRGPAPWKPPEQREEFRFRGDRDELVDQLRRVLPPYRWVGVDHTGGIVVEVSAEALLCADESDLGWLFAENRKHKTHRIRGRRHSQPLTTSPFDRLFGHSGEILGRQVNQALSIDRPDDADPYITIAHQTRQPKVFVNQRDAQEWLRSTPDGGDLWRWNYQYRDKKTRRPLTEYELAQRVLPRKDAPNAREIRRELLTQTWGPKWPVVRLSAPEGKPDVSLAAALERALSNRAQASKADWILLRIIERKAREFAGKLAFAGYDFRSLRSECIRIALSNKQDYPVGDGRLPGALGNLIEGRLRDLYRDQLEDVGASATHQRRHLALYCDGGDGVIEDDHALIRSASGEERFDRRLFDFGLLNERQRKILDLKLVRGLTNKEIAAKLGVNEKTVRRAIESVVN